MGTKGGYIELYPGVYSEDEPALTDGYYTAANAVDKIVSVKNVGKSPAYVRTVFAFEMGSLEQTRFDAIMKANWNIQPTDAGVASIKGKYYRLYYVVYPEALAANTETAPSLLQVLLSKEANNEDMKALDAEEDGYRILVTSQAVQTAGFDSAEQALNEAFGAITKDIHPWAGNVVSTAAELKKALEAGGEVVLAADISLTGKVDYKPDGSTPDRTSVTLNNDVTLNTKEYMITLVNEQLIVAENATLKVESSNGKGGIAVDGDSYIKVQDKGSMNVTNATISGTDVTENFIEVCGNLTLGKNAIVNIDMDTGWGGSVEGVKVEKSGNFVMESNARIILNNTKEDTITGAWAVDTEGKFIMNDQASIIVEGKYGRGVNVQEGSSFDMNGGTIKVEGTGSTDEGYYDSGIYGVYNTSNSCTIDGGTITVVSKNDTYAFGVYNKSSVVINGGTVEVSDQGKNYGVYTVQTPHGTPNSFTINGGTIRVPVRDNAYAVWTGYGSQFVKSEAAKIEGTIWQENY